VSPDDLSPGALKFAHTREIDLGHARVRAARMAYVGGPGYELYVPVEMTRHVYLALMNAGQDLGLRDAGYYALDALRIEAGRRAWGAELGPDETPFEAGLEFAVKLDKPGFIGREALLAQKSAGLPARLAAIRMTEKSPPPRAHYPVVVDGSVVAETTSGALSPSSGDGIAMAYLPPRLATPGQVVQIDIRGRLFAAVVEKKPFHRPNSKASA